MDKVTLYNLDNSGRPRQWSIEVEPVPIVNSNVPDGELPYQTGEIGRIIIETGLVNGAKVPQTIDITKGKNLGKANATTPYTQAVAEAKAKIELQLRSGSVYNLADVKESGTLGSGIKEPMLAQKIDPTGKQKGSKTLEKMKIKGKKIHVQPKLDGNRCLIKVESTPSGVKAGMYTRKGDFMPVQLQHILMRVLEEADVVTDVVLDGELFSNEMSFNELNGHLKRKSNQDEQALTKIKFHLYDIMVDKPYSERYEMLNRFEGRGIEVIPSYEITATDEAIKEKLEEFLAEGHEGLMVRTLDKGYENKRTWQLCKVKLFEDFEAKLLDLELDSMGRLGAFIMEMPEPSTNREGKPITTFKAGTTGLTHEEGLKIVANKEKYLGTMCTVECFGFSEYSVPRFPKMKQLNRQD